MGKTYIAIDLKSFYASVECVERNLDPLKANLVVADESRTDKTICLAVSPSLKARGLSGRSRLFEVRQKVKEIKERTGEVVDFIAAVPRMALYLEYSANIYSVYLKYFSSEDIQVYSVDEVFIDATNYLSLYKMDAMELATRVVYDVFTTTGITATAGIAPNLYLCKIAMDVEAKHQKADENGVRIAYLDEQLYRKKYWNYRPLTDFWRIGPGIARRLEENGMFTLGDVARMSIDGSKWLYKIFGVDAEILIDHAWGYEPCELSDIKKYKPRTTSLTSGQVLHCPYDFQKTRIVVREMVEQLVLDLVDKGLATESMTLTVGYDRENVDSGNYKGVVTVDHYGRAVPKSAHGTANFGVATSSTKKITDGVLELYDRVVDTKLLTRRINISANKLIPDGYQQYDLFTDPGELEKEKKMQKAMLSIHKKFGKNAILKGTDLCEGATMIDRNSQIGGHKA